MAASVSFEKLVAKSLVAEHERIASSILLQLKCHIVVLAAEGKFDNAIDKTIIVGGKTYRYVEKDGKVAVLSVALQNAVRQMGWNEAVAAYKTVSDRNNTVVYGRDGCLVISPHDYFCPDGKVHFMEYIDGRSAFSCEHCGYFPTPNY